MTLGEMLEQSQSPADKEIYDEINHPAHYTEGRKYEPARVAFDWDLDYNTGSALKYISRCGRKPDNSMLKDLHKAKRFLEIEIEELTKRGFHV